MEKTYRAVVSRQMLRAGCISVIMFLAKSHIIPPMESMLDSMLEELDESKLEYFVRWAEGRFFRGVPPVLGVSISPDLEGPACFLPSENRIVVHADAAQFPRWCG